MERGRSLYKAVARIGLLGLCFLACALALPAFSPSEAQAAPPSCNTPLIGGSLKAGGSIGVLPDCSGTPTPTLSYQWQRQARVKQVSVTSGATCVLRADSTVWCRGFNLNGVLGAPATVGVMSDTPVQISGLTSPTQVEVGSQGTGATYACAVEAAGTVKCWGSGTAGQLGNGTTTSSSTPVQVSGITTATQISVGASTSVCARLSDGTLRCWGSGSNGQLGNGTTTATQSTPVTVSGITTATQVSAGGSTSCARLSDGTLRCWGSGTAGQLGNATTTATQSTPVTVSGITSATQVDVGKSGQYACARLSDGTLRCWGNGGNGQLGNNTTTTTQSTPVTVSGISTATQVATGGATACSVLSSGVVSCWGTGSNGQLGNNTTPITQSTPVTVSGISTATQVSTVSPSCALLLDGNLSCWGPASFGQLKPTVTQGTDGPYRVSAPTGGAYTLSSACNFPGSFSSGATIYTGAATITAPAAMPLSKCLPSGTYGAGVVMAASGSSFASLTPVSVTDYSGAWTNLGSASSSSSLDLTSSHEGYLLRAQVTASNGDLPNAIATSASSCSTVQSSSSTYDCAPPTARWTTPATPNNFTDQVYQLNFTETVTGLTASDITVSGTATGCSVALSGSASPYTVTVSGCSNGTVIPTLAANSVADSSSNNGPGAATAASSVTIDRAMTNVVATGGTVTTPGDGYRYHTFTTGGTFTMTTAGPVEYLVVGGGGGGGSGDLGDDVHGDSPGGGGGGGGVLSGTTTATSGAYAITVGNGGGTTYAQEGTNGGNSSFGSIATALGGGGGGTTYWWLQQGTSGKVGASGGGAACYFCTQTGASGTAGQGNSGGSITSSGVSGAGGGGASTAGGNVAVSSGSSSGGDGRSSNISGSAVVYGSGGGGGNTGSTQSLGGSGAGAGGYHYSSAGPGQANRGGGGGGGGAPWQANYDPNGGMGGSGVVIIRYAADSTPPTLSWSSAPSSPNNSASLTYQLTSNETLSGFTAADLSNAGTATGCSFSISGSSSPYTVTASSCSEGTVVLRLLSGSVSDASGNTAPASNLDASSVTVDRTAPTLSWSSTPSSPTNSASLSYSLTSSETLSGFTVADLSNQGTATGCSFSISGSSSPYTVTAASCSEGTVVLRLASGSVSDSAGNTAPGAGLDASSVTIDRTPPSTTWGTTPASPNNSASLIYQLNFGENVTGLTSGDFSNTGTATGCVFTPSASTGSSLSVTVSSCSEGTVVLVLGVNAVSDASGNTAPSSAMSASSVTVDRTAPTLSWSSTPSSPTNSSSLTYQLTSSETLSGFTSGDLDNTGTATGCSFSISGSSSPYTVTASSCSEGTVVLRLASGSVSDSAGNTAPASAMSASSVTIDRTAPTLSWSSVPSSPTNNASLTYSLTSSESLSGFTAADLTNQGTATGCSFAISGSSSPYTVTVTGCSEGTVVAQLSASSVSDSVGNTAPASALSASSVTVDRTAPTISWSSVPSSPTNNASLSYQLTSSETLSGFTAGDLSNIGTATGCSFSVSGSASPYTVTASSCSEGTVVLRLASGSVSDSAGNTAPASNLDASSVTVDRTAPTLSWSSVPSSPTNNASLSYQLTSSETLSGLTSGDLTNTGTATGCSFSVTGSSSPYTVTVSSCSEGTVVLRLASGSVSDAAGNAAPGANLDTSSVTVDRTAPSPVWGSVPSSPTSSSSLSYTLTSAESLSGVVAADFQNAGTATGCVFSPSASSGTSITVTVSSCSEGTVVLRLLSGSVSDAAGNTAPASNLDASSVTVDRTAPTLSWSSVPSSPSNSSSLTYQLTSSETLSGFTSADLSNTGTATGCSFSVSGSSSPYTVTASSCSEGTVVLRLASGSVSDAAGNAAPASNLDASSVTVDRTAPTLSWSSVPSSPTNNASLSYQLTSSETLSGFTSGDLTNTGTATGCSFSVSGSSSPYTVTASSCSEGTVVLRLASGSVSDAAGNAAPGANLDASSVTVDRTAPTISWSSVPSSPTNSASLSYSLSSSETLSGLTSGDISNTGTATGCSFSVSGSSSPYTVTVSSCSEGTVVLRLASGSVSDSAGNAAPASALDASSVTVDRTPPTITWGVTPASPTNASALTYQINFNENVTGLTSGDFSNTGTATGCVFTPSASTGSTLSVTVSSCSEGTVVLVLGANAVSDASGNTAPSSAMSASSVTVDRTAPTASFASTPSSPSSSASLTYSLSFSESVSGLASGDLSNTGTATGCVFSVSGSGDSYTVTASSCSEGTVILRLASGAASDSSSNSGPSSSLDASSVTIDRTAPTASWSSVPSSPTNSSSLSYTLSFSESVTGLTGADFSNQGTATGCSFSPVSSSGSSIAVSVSGCSEGTVILRLASGSVSDASGNTAPAANLDASSVTIDRTDPAASWTEPASPTAEATLSYGLSFPEPVSGLAAADLSNQGTATGCSFSVSGFGDTYTVEASGCSEGTVVLRLASGAVSDSAGNSSAHSDAASVTIARSAASASFTEPASPTSSASLSYGVSFSKAVTGFTGADLSNIGTATGCSFSVSGSGDTYTAEASGCSEGTVVLRLAAESVANQLGGRPAPEANADASSVTIDRTAPTASFAQEPASPTNASTLSYDLSFSESVTGLTGSDFSNQGSATGCSFTPSMSSGSSISVSVTDCSEGTVVLRLASGSVSDEAGNSGPSSATSASSVTIDRTAPTASFTQEPASPTNASTLAYDLSFSEPVTGLTSGDFSNTGTASGCSFSVSGSGDSYTVTASSCSDGTVVLRLASGSVSDAAGNDGPASALDASSVTVDRAPATASWGEPASPTKATSLSYTLDFSKGVTGLTAGDLSNTGTATGCSFSVSGSSDSYTVTASSCSEGTVVLRLASGAAQSLAGSASPASSASSSSVTIDRTAPTASFTQEPASPTNASTLSYDLSFSESVIGLTGSDFSNQGSATGCSFSPVSSSGSSISVSVTDCSEGTVVLRLASGSVSDAAGNAGPVSAVSASPLTIDRTSPTASFTAEPSTPTIASNLSYSLSFSEPVSGLTSGDFSNTGSATGCSFSVSGSGNSYTVTASSCSDGTVVLRLASGSVTDAAGNDGPSSNLDASSVTVDRAPATVSWGEPASPTKATSLSYILNFSKPVTGLASGDISNTGSATGCSFSVSGSSDSYTVTASSCSGGTVILRLAAGSVQTLSGAASPSSAESAAAVTIDRTAPTASFTSVPASPTGAESLDYELTFSEEISGLTSGDFSNQGTATDCVFSTSASSGTTFTVNASGCSSGSLIVRLASGAVVDQALNTGPASAVSASSVTVALIPVNSEAPVVTGDAEVGQTLTASSGTWNRSPSYAYQWQSSANGSTGWADISGEISSAYTVTSSQSSRYLRVKVTATNAVGSAVAYSDATSQVIEDPQNPVSPSISGNAYPGNTLTLSAGTWTGAPSPTLAYQWQYCDIDGLNCQDIQGETSPTYTVQNSDRGYRIRGLVTGSNTAGQLVAYSAPTAEITDQAPSPPVLQSEISITSSPEAGQAATTDGGTWSGYPEPTLTYQWQTCEIGGSCSDVSSQQAAVEGVQVAGRDKDFTPTTERAGKQLRVVVTATNSEGAVSEVSPRSGGVRARPFRSSSPSFSGAAAVNQMLIANPGQWGGYPAPSFTYSWKLCDKDGNSCSSIAGSGNGYRGQVGHVGKRMKFTVTATNSLGSESADSGASSAVQGPPVNTALPQISGGAISGQTVNVSNGSWDSDPAATFTYQWQRCDLSGNRCANIEGSNEASYAVTSTDTGQRLRARVTATNLRGQMSALSAVSAPVLSGVEMISGPAISGSPIVGRAVAAVAGKWVGYPAPTFTYQWQRCDSAGSNCQDLSDKTNNSYTLAFADYGKRLRLKVTASNASSSRQVFSAASSIVGAPPILKDAPEIVGDAKLGETLGVDEGQWESTTSPSYGYQWQQCNAAGEACKDIRRATGEQFEVQPAQVGATMKVKVISQNHIGSSSADTAPTDQVEGRPTNLSSPSISGTAQTRSTLTASPGSWSALPSANYSYQWQRCRGVECSDIAGASDASYNASRADVGFRLRVNVAAENTLGSSTVSSAMTSQVKIAMFNLNLDVAAGGRVRVFPSGLFCQGKCKMAISEGTQVRLEPEPQTGYVFDSFSGQSSFEMTQNASVNAQFSPSPTLSLSYSISPEQIFLWETVTVNLTAKVTPPTEMIRSQAGVRACLVVPDTLTVPTVPEGASLVGGRLCWLLGEVTPPYERNLSVTLRARSRTGQRSLSPYITALNRETVDGVKTSGTGLVRVSVKR